MLVPCGRQKLFGKPGTVVAGIAATVLMCLPGSVSRAQSRPPTAPAGQGLSGTWAGLWEVLASGEKDKVYLEIHQDGTRLTGTMSTLGHLTKVEGTLKGSQFALFDLNHHDTPQISGEVRGKDLYLTRHDQSFLAVPVAAGERYPAYKYINPPALHPVASNGLARTPPMGWNAWNFFQERGDDAIVRAAADAMVSSGMRDAGYVYINIDDTWEGTRDAQGNLRSNKKFPDMKALADYVHSKGLKLGIYSSPGPRTCQDYPGSYGYEQQDAKQYAAWGIDFLKYDWCGARMIYQNDQMQAVYQKMGEALLQSGRPIVYSLCQYGSDNVQDWGAEVGGNMWRTTGDIRNTWTSMMANVEKQVPDAPHAGPGHWNDPDMLELGNGQLTADEGKTQISLWALASAPLLAGNDLSKMTPETSQILINKDVIAVDQDPLGKQGSPLNQGDLQTWVKPLSDGSVAVGVVNRSAAATKAEVKLSDLGLHGKVQARDLWSHAPVSFQDGVYSASVPSHGVLMLRVRPAN